MFRGLPKCPGGRLHLLMQEMRVWSLGWEDPLEKEMVTHFSILAWEIPQTEGSGGLQSMGSQRVAHKLSNSTHTHTHTHTQWAQKEMHLHGTNTITSGPEVHVSWSHVREPFKVAEVTPTSSLWYNAEPIWILLPRPEFESCPLLCNLWQDSKMPQGYLYN